MRLGCIAIGEIHCDGCGRTVKHPDRYLAMYGDEGIEPKKVIRYCTDCALSKGYARRRMEKGEEVLTFFPE